MEQTRRTIRRKTKAISRKALEDLGLAMDTAESELPKGLRNKLNKYEDAVAACVATDKAYQIYEQERYCFILTLLRLVKKAKRK